MVEYGVGPGPTFRVRGDLAGDKQPPFLSWRTTTILPTSFRNPRYLEARLQSVRDIIFSIPFPLPSTNGQGCRLTRNLIGVSSECLGDVAQVEDINHSQYLTYRQFFCLLVS
jgi:hypothetical protein